MRHCAAIFLMSCALAFGIRGAHAEDGRSVDCGDIAMKFTGPGFKVTCMDFSDHTALSGGTRVELLSAQADDEQQILNALVIRALGSIYLKRRGMEEDVRSYFSEENVRDWQQTDNVAGFEFAQYTGKTDEGGPAKCIAFRRQINRRYEGFGRIVVGFGCATHGREQLIETLKMLTAPGG